MPNTEQVHLPSWESRRDIYNRYKDDTQEMEGDTISLDMFYKIWRKDFSNVVIPEVKYQI